MTDHSPLLNSTQDFHNDTTQAERRQVLKDTYLARAEADADLAAAGRFKQQTQTRDEDDDVG